MSKDDEKPIVYREPRLSHPGNPDLDFVYIDGPARRAELEKLTKEQLITIILQAEEDAIDARYNAMGEDL